VWARMTNPRRHVSALDWRACARNPPQALRASACRGSLTSKLIFPVFKYPTMARLFANVFLPRRGHKRFFKTGIKTFYYLLILLCRASLSTVATNRGSSGVGLGMGRPRGVRTRVA